MFSVFLILKNQPTEVLCLVHFAVTVLFQPLAGGLRGGIGTRVESRYDTLKGVTPNPRKIGRARVFS